MTYQAEDMKGVEELLASIREAIQEHTARQAAGLAVEGVDGGGPAIGNGNEDDLLLDGFDSLGMDDLDDDIVMLDSARDRGFAEEAAPWLAPRPQHAPQAEEAQSPPADPLLEEPATAPPLDAAFLSRMMGAPQSSGPQPAVSGKAAASRSVRKQRQRPAPQEADKVHNGLLERQVKRVLEPLLERWMEERLPQLVEELVREELRRLLDPDRPARSRGRQRAAG